MKIIISCDHAGWELANQIKEYLEKEHEIINGMPECFDGLDSYAENTRKPRKLLAKGKAERAIFVCGSGVGVCISANREKGVRAVNSSSQSEVEMARKHNNVNCLCLGAKNVTLEKAKKLIEAFLTTNFEGGRHEARIKQLDT